VDDRKSAEIERGTITKGERGACAVVLEGARGGRERGGELEKKTSGRKKNDS